MRSPDNRSQVKLTRLKASANASQRFSQGRLPHPRAVFNQQMTTRQHTTKSQAHLGLFAQQHPADSLDQGQQLRCSQGITPSTAPS